MTGPNQPRQRRGKAPIAFACLLATGAAVSAFLAASPISATAATRPIPTTANAALTKAALGAAQNNGDPAPTSIKAVATTHARALLAATPGDTITYGTRQAVYLVIMTGEFTYHGPIPAGAHVPRGSYLALVFNAASLALEDLGLSFRPPPVALRGFGPVTNLRG